MNIDIDVFNKLVNDVPMYYGGEKIPFSDSIRNMIIEKDKNCQLCRLSDTTCYVHHIDPRGSGEIDNGILLCTKCHHIIHLMLSYIKNYPYYTNPMYENSKSMKWLLERLTTNIYDINDNIKELNCLKDVLTNIDHRFSKFTFFNDDIMNRYIMYLEILERNLRMIPTDVRTKYGVILLNKHLKFSKNIKEMLK